MPFQVNGIDISYLSTGGTIDATLSPYYPGLSPTTSTVQPATVMLATKYTYTANSIDISNRIMASYTVFNTGSGLTGTIPSWCNRISVLAVGGGGGGASGAGNWSLYNGAAGGAGGHGAVRFSGDSVTITGGSPYTISVGAPGTPGPHGGNHDNSVAGGGGGTTTVVIGSISLTAPGGRGGNAAGGNGGFPYYDANVGNTGASDIPISIPGNFMPNSTAGNGGTPGPIGPAGNGVAGGAGGAGAVWMWYKMSF